MEIFKLFGTIMVDSADAEKSISKTGEEAEGLGSKLKNGITTAAKWAAGVASAAVAVGSAMVAAAKDTASELDVIDKASIRMDMSAESYQELAYQAGLCGVEMTTLEKAAKKLEGTDLNMDAALEQIYALEDADERAALACELFGETVAYQMTPMLNASGEEMAAMAQEANDLGLVMSQDAVSSGAAMNDMFSKVEESISTLKNGLVAEFMPYVMEILQWVIDNIPMIKETVQSVMDTILPIVEPILDAVMDALPPIMNAIKKLLDWITPYLEPILTGVMAVVDAVFSLFKGDLDGFIEGIKTALINLGTALYGIGKDIFTFLWDGIKNVWTNIKSWIDEKVTWLKDKITFWKSSNDSMETDGSHASGLNYVPYDGYVAELHKGETVLSAGASRSLVSDVVSGISGILGNISAEIKNLTSEPNPETSQVEGDKTSKSKNNVVQDFINGITSAMGVDVGLNSHAEGSQYAYDRSEPVAADNSASIIAGVLNGLKGQLKNDSSSPIELTLNIDGKAFAHATYGAMQYEAKRVGGSLVV